MHIIIAIAWIYVVLMMSITEHSIIAGIMTFLLYGVLPLTIILYLLNGPNRKRRRLAAENTARSSATPPEPQPEEHAQASSPEA